MNYIIYNTIGEILRTVQCPPTLAKVQLREGEFVMEGKANDVTQKVVGGKVVNKTPEEIERDSPTLQESEPIPVEKRPAVITNGQWQDVLNRLKNIEDKIA